MNSDQRFHALFLTLLKIKARVGGGGKFSLPTKDACYDDRGSSFRPEWFLSDGAP